jgi:Fur family ferric uptake transcriptional regulator
MNLLEFKLLLKHYGMKSTQFRLKLFHAFSENDRALNFHEFEGLMHPLNDRATLYRTLKVFVRYGIIHRIIDPDGNLGYALMLVSAQQLLDGKADQHLHFCCIACNQTFCIEDPRMPAVSLPESYTVHSLNMTITGVCKTCNDKNVSV